ncbi:MULTISPECIES: glycosyltransferase [unclassified Paludibacterium]|uniref:glycosyltransferase family protein n=1 Tax=unclassified Paludibacterium TaxID=2618429 RepID=UPI001C0561F3|nr:glycosyltransferase [Paludibacterium sp. B53371]BEV73308.1 hypothetical protein THUN1379_27900 [Paludibacterium sp. THUN1379]
MIENSNRVLVLSHFNDGINRVFEDYCNGIRRNAGVYRYIDYIETYHQLGRRRLESLIDEEVEKYAITHVFFVWWSCDLTFSLDYLSRLSSKAKIVINYFDTEYFFEGVDRYYAQVASLVLLPDWLSRYRYEHLNIPAHTSFALYDKSAYKKLDSIEKDIDVSFVGNLKQSNRAEYIDYLRSNGVNVQTYGVGSENGFASFEKMIEVFNRSKINLNFTGTADFSGYAIRLPSINQRIKQSKGRPIEIALCGGFVLSQHAAGIENMFALGDEFDVFHTREELLEKVRLYLSENNRREAMAQQAYERAIKTYDIDSGFKLVFDKLNGGNLINNSVPVCQDVEFRRNYAAFRFFYVMLFLLQFKIKLAFEEVWVVIKTRRINFSAAYHFSIRGLLHYLRARPKLEQFFKNIRKVVPVKLKY